MFTKLFKPKKDMIVITIKTFYGDRTNRKVYISAFGKTIVEQIDLDDKELIGIKKVIDVVNGHVGIDMIRIYD